MSDVTRFVSELFYRGIHLPLQIHTEDHCTIADASGADILVVDQSSQWPDDKAQSVATLLKDLINSAAIPADEAVIQQTDAGEPSKDAYERGRSDAYDEAATLHEEDAQDYNRARDPGMANHQRSYARKFRKRAEIIRSALDPATSQAKGGDGVAAIAAERQRQIEAEGWTPEHDDQHAQGEMAAAAACYAIACLPKLDIAAWCWPWDQSWWKPTDRRRNLVKAGALIAAEIDRLDRAELGASAPTDQSEGEANG